MGRCLNIMFPRVDGRDSGVDCFGMAEARRDVAVFWCEIDYPVQPKTRMCASRVASRNSTSLGLVSLAGNRDEAVEGVIEADPIAAAVRALMAKQPEWTGLPRSFWRLLQEWWMNVSPNQSPGRIARERCRVACVELRPSSARSA
jgi:hypothetical protein